MRTLVNLHGGRVVADSAGLGQGSRFTVRLPMCVGSTLQASASASDGPGPAAASKPLRILVVDDNEDAATSMAMLLQQMGHAVSVAHDGLDAVREAVRFNPNLCSSTSACRA